jgi:hypothetical protein
MDVIGGAALCPVPHPVADWIVRGLLVALLTTVTVVVGSAAIAERAQRRRARLRRGNRGDRAGAGRQAEASRSERFPGERGW